MFTPLPAATLANRPHPAALVAPRPTPAHLASADRYQRCDARDTFLAEKGIKERLKDIGRKVREKGREVEKKVNEGLDDIAGRLFPPPEPVPVPIPIPVDDPWGRR